MADIRNEVCRYGGDDDVQLTAAKNSVENLRREVKVQADMAEKYQRDAEKAQAEKRSVSDQLKAMEAKAKSLENQIKSTESGL